MLQPWAHGGEGDSGCCSVPQAVVLHVVFFAALVVWVLLRGYLRNGMGQL